MPFLLTAGCGPYLASELPTRVGLPNRGTWPSGEESQLTMSARLPRDGNEVADFFGIDLLTYNILPVEVYFETVSETSDFQVQVDDFEFSVGSSESRLERISAADVCDRVRARPDMLRDYRSKALEDFYLWAASPSYNRIGGVLFFSPTQGSLSDVDYRKGYLEVKVRRFPVGKPGASDNLEPEFNVRVDFRRL